MGKAFTAAETWRERFEKGEIMRQWYYTISDRLQLDNGLEKTISNPVFNAVQIQTLELLTLPQTIYDKVKKRCSIAWAGYDSPAEILQPLLSAADIRIRRIG
jgi:hypothetical protein